MSSCILSGDWLLTFLKNSVGGMVLTSVYLFFSWLVGHEGRICQESYPPATEGHSGSEKKRAQNYSGAILHTVITLKMYFRHFYHKQLTTIQSKHRSVKAANQHYCLLV